jgi:aspartyl-tRNA(Asn)/glutamyl-tRNA(Gln) amidotransferase subunit B
MKKLRAILRYIGTCDGDMEKGNMRGDANVSVRKIGAPLGTRCEIKNLNSMRFLNKAIEFEAMRQVEILENGGEISQETRLFDSTKGETRTMRTKEDAHDYRYFPDPDLLPLEFSEEFVAKIKAGLPELPDQKKERYIKDFGLTLYDASVIIAEKAVTLYFEELVASTEPKLAANWMTSELFARLNKQGFEIENSPISAKNFAGLLALISDNTISGKIAKDVLDFMFENPSKTAAQIVEEKGLKQVTDTGAIEKVIDEVLASNPDKIAEYKSGKDKLFGFFVGQVMKASGGKANPAMLNDLLKEKLG